MFVSDDIPSLSGGFLQRQVKSLRKLERMRECPQEGVRPNHHVLVLAPRVLSLAPRLARVTTQKVRIVLKRERVQRVRVQEYASQQEQLPTELHYVREWILALLLVERDG